MKKKDKTVIWVILAVIAVLILSGTIDLSGLFSVAQSNGVSPLSGGMGGGTP